VTVYDRERTIMRRTGSVMHEEGYPRAAARGLTRAAGGPCTSHPV